MTAVELDKQTRSEKLFRFVPHMVFSGIIALWVLAWWVGFKPDFLKPITSQPLNDIFLSVNTLFAGLAFFGIIWTSFTQYQDLKESKKLIKETAEANSAMARASERMAKHSDEKTVFDLFQTYCSEYFQTVKDRSMNVLIASVRSKEYGEFVVSRLFVAEQLPLPAANCHRWLRNIPGWDQYDDFLENERKDRYKLDELINFFSLLVGLSNAKEVIGHCDFSYSWWRPLLWMLAIEQKHRYDTNAIVRKYSTGLYLQEVVRKLDLIYGFVPFESRKEAWAFIVSHPKIVGYGIDQGYIAASASAGAGRKAEI